MCLAIPGKIIEIKNDVATIDYELEKREAKIIDGEYKIGDYVIAQGKIIIQKVPKKDVDAWLNLVKNG